MKQTETYYAILGLKAGASAEDVKKAYRNLVKTWHPDCFPNNTSMQQQAEEKIKEINEAYGTLKSYLADSKSIHSINSSQTVTCSTKPANPEDFYRQGEENFKKEKYEAAIESLTTAIKIDRNYIEAYRLRSIVFEQLGYEYRASSDRGKVAELERLKNPEAFTKTCRSSAQNSRKYQASSPPVSPSEPQNWRCLFTFSEHSKEISTLSTYRHGKILVSGSRDNTIKLWNLQTGKLICTLFGHSAPVLAIAISSDGQILASGSADQTIKLWHINTASLIRTIEGHTGEIRSICMSADRQILISGSADCTVKFWQLSSGQLLRSITKRKYSVNSIALSSNNQRFIIGYGDGIASLWFMNIINSLQTLNCYANCTAYSPILSVLIHPHGDRFATGCADGSIQIWDIGSGTSIHRLTSHSKAVNSVAFSPDGSELASVSVDQKINIWDWQKDLLCHTLTPTTNITSVSYGRDHNVLIVGGSDGSIKIWQRENFGKP